MNDENRNSLGNFIQSINNQTQQSESNNGSPQNRGKFDGEKSLKNLLIAIAIVVGFFTLLGVITGAFGSDDTPNEQVKKTEVTNSKQKTTSLENTKKSQQAVKSNSQSVKVDFNLTPEQFKNKFNETVPKYGGTLQIDNLKMGEGNKKGTFEYRFTDYLGIMGNVNDKTNKLDNIMYISGSDGTITTATDSLMLFGVIIEVTNPELQAKERGQILGELGFLDKNLDINKLDNETTVNHVRYSILSMGKGILVFNASTQQNQ